MLPPKELVGYIDIKDGKIVAAKPIPEDLKELFEKFSKEFEEFLVPSIDIVNTK